jgi:hypothetical protein
MGITQVQDAIADFRDHTAKHRNDICPCEPGNLEKQQADIVAAIDSLRAETTLIATHHCKYGLVNSENENSASICGVCGSSGDI